MTIAKEDEHYTIISSKNLWFKIFFICIKQLKMEEIFLIYYEKIIFNIKILFVPQRQSKTYFWT